MFSRIRDQGERDNEPEEIRHLTKKQLYKFISIRKVLWDEEARCCTRETLIRAYREEIYTISREELLVYESRLQPDEILKSPFFNVGQMMARLDRLLVIKGKPQLGFPPGTLCDDTWATRVLRFEVG